MKSYHTLGYNRILLPIGDILTRQCVMKWYKFYNESQWWDQEKLIAYQNTMLHQTINIAYKEVPFYKELYDRRKIKISDVKTKNDLILLPLVTKDMLRKAYPRRCTRNTNWPWKEYFTSGSTGNPMAIRIDNKTMSHARSLMLLRATFSGWKIGDPHLQMGISLQRGFVKKFKDILLKTNYISAFNLTDSVLDKSLYILEKRKISYIMGYPGSIFLLAKRAGEVGFTKKMSGIVTWGDNLYPHYRKMIENQFNCKVTDTYGCGEGIQVASQCGYNNGSYHIFMPHVVVEFVKEGMPVLHGEEGEILLTRLDPGAMPLIRYKIGDIGRKSNATHCECHRGFEMMESIDGRDTDIVITPNGNRLIVHFFTGIFEYYPSIHTFQIVQEKIEEILVKIVPNINFSKDDWEKIKKEIKIKGDSDLDIKMETVSEIPLESSSKRRFVISHLVKK